MDLYTFWTEPFSNFQSLCKDKLTADGCGLIEQADMSVTLILSSKLTTGKADEHISQKAELFLSSLRIAWVLFAVLLQSKQLQATVV